MNFNSLFCSQRKLNNSRHFQSHPNHRKPKLKFPFQLTSNFDRKKKIHSTFFLHQKHFNFVSSRPTYQVAYASNCLHRMRLIIFRSNYIISPFKNQSLHFTPIFFSVDCNFILFKSKQDRAREFSIYITHIDDGRHE